MKTKNITEMNKRFYLSILPAMAFAACALTFASCGGDEEDSYNPPSKGEAYAGKLVTQVGDYKFYYDGDNRCYRMTSYDDGTYEIDYSKGTITVDYGDQVLNVKFNGDGYVTEMSGSWVESYGGEVHSGSGIQNIAYDGDGHLKSISVSSTEKYSYDGESGSVDATGTVECVWVGGNLVSSEGMYEEREGGERWWERSNYDLTYDETLDNETGQVPVAISDIFGDYTNSLPLVGLFGKGPAHLPESVSEKIVDSDGYGYEYRSNVAYGLNADGTISWERLDNDTYRYSYKTVTSQDEDSAPAYSVAKAMPAGKKKLRVRDFFMHKRNRK